MHFICSFTLVALVDKYTSRILFTQQNIVNQATLLVFKGLQLNV